ncbi:Protein pim1 [Lachnellula subtilissima]|uniref:Protein pim1 n=1 Tax=Lachnellula subtilissima TaxID=602034 RepID=A0A8H8RYU2_9HELO|nr:Protein pim1 [Lachnellula subtilissima]
MPRLTRIKGGNKPATKSPSSVPGTTKPRPKSGTTGKNANSVLSAEPARSKRRQQSEGPAPRASKKFKADRATNDTPSQKLDIYVFGDGESGELGLGPKPIQGKKPTNVRYPRRNTLLDPTTVGVVQVAVGGMHCIALTYDQKIITWGVNDNVALGRDTTWEARTRDIDQDSDAEDSDEESDLNPKECTPTSILMENFGKNIPTFVQVAATDSASFVVTSEGSVYGWGTFSANDGIFGFSTKDAIQAAKTKDHEKKLQRKPVPVLHLTKIKSIATGNNHVVALDSNGKAYTWGAGEQNQLGRRIIERTRYASLTPCRLALSKIKQVASGAFHSFAISENGLVYAWGSNNFGQTGIVDRAGESDAVIPRPIIVESLRPYKIREITGGEHHSIACTDDGKLLVWGRCDEGQAGFKLENLAEQDLLFDSRGKPRILLKPTLVSGIHAVSVAAAIDNSIAVTAEGKAYSWGFSANYRTGLGTDETVKEATLLAKGDIANRKITFAGCGGQFSILAGPARG